MDVGSGAGGKTRSSAVLIRIYLKLCSQGGEAGETRYLSETQPGTTDSKRVAKSQTKKDLVLCVKTNPDLRSEGKTEGELMTREKPCQKARKRAGIKKNGGGGDWTLQSAAARWHR